jgi:hypothetical protein
VFVRGAAFHFPYDFRMLAVVDQSTWHPNKLNEFWWFNFRKLPADESFHETHSARTGEKV